MKYLISLHLVQYKYVATIFKKFTLTLDRPKCIGKLLCVSVNKPLNPYISFSIQSILYQIRTACINLHRFEEYLRELESSQRDGKHNDDKPHA